MALDYNLLITYGGCTRKYRKGEVLFREGETPRYFYQLAEGKVRVTSLNEEGRELIQGVFTDGESFGEPPLLIGRPYPSSAVAVADSVVVRIDRERWLYLLQDDQGSALQLLRTFAGRIYQKAVTAQILVSQRPEDKLLQLFREWKGTGAAGPVKIPYTRQQLADFTGLRVETVIRTLLRMHRDGLVSIIDHKVYY